MMITEKIKTLFPKIKLIKASETWSFPEEVGVSR